MRRVGRVPAVVGVERVRADRHARLVDDIVMEQGSELDRGRGDGGRAHMQLGRA